MGIGHELSDPRDTSAPAWTIAPQPRPDVVPPREGIGRNHPSPYRARDSSIEYSRSLRSPETPKRRSPTWVAVSKPGYGVFHDPTASWGWDIEGGQPGLPQGTHVARLAPQNGRVKGEVTLSHIFPSLLPCSLKPSLLCGFQLSGKLRAGARLWAWGSPGPDTSLGQL